MFLRLGFMFISELPFEVRFAFGLLFLRPMASKDSGGGSKVS